jgi:hypothetical protein
MDNLTGNREIIKPSQRERAENHPDVLTNASTPETRQQLEKILQNTDLDPKLADAIRAQIATMDDNQSSVVLKESISVSQPKISDSVSSVEILHTLHDGDKLIDSSGNPKVDLEDFMNRLNNPRPEDLEIKNRLN